MDLKVHKLPEHANLTHCPLSCPRHQATLRQSYGHKEHDLSGLV